MRENCGSAAQLPDRRSRAERLPRRRAHYDQLSARDVGRHAALRQLGNRLVGILHGCLKTGTSYDEATAWAHHQQDLQTVA